MNNFIKQLFCGMSFIALSAQCIAADDGLSDNIEINFGDSSKFTIIQTDKDKFVTTINEINSNLSEYVKHSNKIKEIIANKDNPEIMYSDSYVKSAISECFTSSTRIVKQVRALNTIIKLPQNNENQDAFLELLDELGVKETFIDTMRVLLIKFKNDTEVKQFCRGEK